MNVPVNTQRVKYNFRIGKDFNIYLTSPYEPFTNENTYVLEATSSLSFGFISTHLHVPGCTSAHDFNFNPMTGVFTNH